MTAKRQEILYLLTRMPENPSYAAAFDQLRPLYTPGSRPDHRTVRPPTPTAGQLAPRHYRSSGSGGANAGAYQQGRVAQFDAAPAP